LKGLSHPRTAVRGNTLGALGMLLAVAITLIHQRVLSFELILIGLAIGTAAGVLLALKTQMTAMPQLVAFFNGSGGAASVLVASAALLEVTGAQQSGDATLAGQLGLQLTVSTVVSALIGSVTFLGSLIAV